MTAAALAHTHKHPNTAANDGEGSGKSLILPLGELGVSQTVYNFYKDALAGVESDHVGRQDLEESSDEDC